MLSQYLIYIRLETHNKHESSEAHQLYSGDGLAPFSLTITAELQRKAA